MLLVAPEDLVSGFPRTPDTHGSSARLPKGGPRNAGARPRPNALSTASPPSPCNGRGRVLPMCPVQNVTHVSGRSPLVPLGFSGRDRTQQCHSRVEGPGRAPPRVPDLRPDSHLTASARASLDGWRTRKSTERPPGDRI